MIVGGEGELQTENFGVVLSLLDSRTNRIGVRLRLDDAEREIAAVTQEVIGKLPRPAPDPGPGDGDAAISEIRLLGELVGRGVPAGGKELGLVQRSAGIGLVRGAAPRGGRHGTQRAIDADKGVSADGSSGS